MAGPDHREPYRHRTDGGSTGRRPWRAHPGQGVTEDGRAKVKSPSGTLSTAEAISVVTSGLALATHFGDGVLRAADVAGGITGAVIQDPVADRAVWQEYLETVIRDRDDWSDFYRACRDAAG